MATRLVKAAAMASAALALAGAVLQRAVVRPREARARAELAELEAEDVRRAQRAAFETPDASHPSLRTEVDAWDRYLLGLKAVLPESRDAARDGFLAELRRIGAWSVELESLDWSDRVSGGARHSAGKARVRIDPSGRGWLETVRNLQHIRQRITVDCVDVSDLSDPSSPVTLEVTLHAQPEPWRMAAPRSNASSERGFRWADVFRRPPKAPVESREVPDASPAPVLASIWRGVGSYPEYTVVVHEDGIVEYDGRYNVKIEGKHRYRIEMDRVRVLSEAFDAAGFSSFDDYYPEYSTCGSSVKVSHRGKEVSHAFHGDLVPPSLTKLEDDFERLVGTDRWIGTEEERAVFRDR